MAIFTKTIEIKVGDKVKYKRYSAPFEEFVEKTGTIQDISALPYVYVEEVTGYQVNRYHVNINSIIEVISNTNAITTNTKISKDEPISYEWKECKNGDSKGDTSILFLNNDYCKYDKKYKFVK